MKKQIIAACILFFSINLSAQNIKQIIYINNLGDKKTATFEDAVNFFVISLNGNPAGFKGNINSLKKVKIIIDEKYGPNDKLRRGMVAIMIARYMKLDNSLFYLIFKTERYAFRACVAKKIMQNDQSEWDILSGEELIEIMAIVDEVRGVEK